jgi:hypothetical protein
VHGASLAARVPHTMRHASAEDFPASWPLGETALRSRESSYNQRKFGLRLDEGTSEKAEALTQTFDRSAAEVIRQRIFQARPADFPQSCQLAVGEHQQEGDR